MGVMPASRSRISCLSATRLSPFGRAHKPFRTCTCRGFVGCQTRKGNTEMGLLDKLTGRAKKAAGDLADDPSLRREGRQEERKGEAKDELANAQDRADAKADEVADLERKTA